MQREDVAYDEATGPSDPKGLFHHLLSSREGPLWEDLRELSEEEFAAYREQLKRRRAA